MQFHRCCEGHGGASDAWRPVRDARDAGAQCECRAVVGDAAHDVEHAALLAQLADARLALVTLACKRRFELGDLSLDALGTRDGGAALYLLDSERLL